MTGFGLSVPTAILILHRLVIVVCIIPQFWLVALRQDGLRDAWAWLFSKRPAEAVHLSRLLNGKSKIEMAVWPSGGDALEGLDLGADCKQTSREDHPESVAPFTKRQNMGSGGCLRCSW